MPNQINLQPMDFFKRGLGAGFAGIKNELFEYDNTRMLFGDAKEVLQELLAELKGTSAAAGAA